MNTKSKAEQIRAYLKKKGLYKELNAPESAELNDTIDGIISQGSEPVGYLVDNEFISSDDIKVHYLSLEWHKDNAISLYTSPVPTDIDGLLKENKDLTDALSLRTIAYDQLVEIDVECKKVKSQLSEAVVVLEELYRRDNFEHPTDSCNCNCCIIRNCLEFLYKTEKES